MFKGEILSLLTDHQPEELLQGGTKTVGYKVWIARTKYQIADRNPYRRIEIGRGLKLIGLARDCRPSNDKLVPLRQK